MASPIQVGDYELNYQHRRCSPTLIPSIELEKRLDIQLLKSEPKHNSTCEPPAGKQHKNRFAIHIHCFYLEELEQILAFIRAAPSSIDLWISTDTTNKRDQIINLCNRKGLGAELRSMQITITPNRGRNVGPLLGCMLEKLSDYTAVLHLHTKRHSHNPTAGKIWFEDLQRCLIGSNGEVEAILNAFSDYPELGVVMPRPASVIRPHCNWGDNLATAELLCKTIWPLRQLNFNAPLIFPAGMMFWFRPAALQGLQAMLNQLQYWPPEPLQPDGTPFHALERLVAHSCEAAGLSWALCRPQQEWATLEGLQAANMSVWSSCAVEYGQAIATVANRLAACEDQRNALESELNALRTSRSWALTAPLRRIYDRWR